MSYEMVIGLEVHVELKTESKIFCSCPTTFGAEPNTHCCPVCMGMPGTLPVLNEQVVLFAAKAGMATNCTIARYSKQDRKNYFYPDLPKAYQISQYDLPLCEHGYIEIDTGSSTKKIGITRIHIEEDAGKLIHDHATGDEHGGTLCDYNRCGVPLIEIVSEPDIRSAEEAVAYVKKLRDIMLYTGVSDCKMEEGSLRCDVNLSVHKVGEPFGTRTEMKNLNSFQFISKAIEYEYKRQVDILENGGTVIQETRRYDQSQDMTFSMRAKENANDYRYFPDPDLIPIILSDETLDTLRSEIPVLPDERKAKYISEYALTPYDANIIVGSRQTADYFEQAAAKSKYPKTTANIMISDIIKLYENEGKFPVSAGQLASLSDIIGDGKISSSAGKRILKAMCDSDKTADEIADELKLWQISSRDELIPILKTVIAGNEKSVTAYKAGKGNAIQALVGQGMKATRGQGNPEMMLKLLEELLNK